MKNRNRMVPISILASVLTVAFLNGCHTGRAVTTLDILHVPNTITERGFRYVKRAIEVRYEVKGLFPADLDRTQALNRLEIANEAYAKLVEQAGGVAANEVIVNLAVEATLIRYGNELFMVVAIYADKVAIEVNAMSDDWLRENREDILAAIREGIRRAEPVG